MLGIEELKLISNYLYKSFYRMIFYYFWVQMKKQHIFINPKECKIDYCDGYIYIQGVKVNAPLGIIYSEGLKGFTIICPSKITTPKKYNCIFYRRN